MSQHKQTLRKSFRSAIANKKVADAVIDALAASQSKLNSLLTKLDVQDEGAMDEDFVQLLKSDIFNPDIVLSTANKSVLRKVIRSSFANKKAADALLDAMNIFDIKYNALLAKLDAQAGMLLETDFSELKVEVASIDAKIIVSALAHKKLALTILNSLIASQNALNAVLVKLDAGSITGECASLKIEAIDPESF